MVKRDIGRISVAAPPDHEVADALAQLRGPGALCWARVATSNSGLSLSLSFQPCKASVASGSLEVALRKAKVGLAHIEPIDAWSWNDAFLKFASTQTTPVERTVTQGETAGLSRANETQVGTEFGATFKPPWVELLAKLTLSDTRRDEAKKEANRSQQEKTVGAVAGVQVHDGPFGFNLLLDARPFDDLVARNSQLQRVEIIDLPEPAAVRLEDVSVALDMDLAEGEGIDHAFRIRHATGAWEPLRTDTNKRILAELLMSKFIQPLHDSVRLWPHSSETT